MREESIDRRLFIHIPNTNTLIIRTGCHNLAIIRDNTIPDPFLMSLKSLLIKTSTNFPKLNGHIPTRRYKTIPIKHKINIANIMIMSMKGLTTQVIIIQVPQFNTQITRRRHEIISFQIVVYTGYGIFCYDIIYLYGLLAYVRNRRFRITRFLLNRLMNYLPVGCIGGGRRGRLWLLCGLINCILRAFWVNIARRDLLLCLGLDHPLRPLITIITG